MTDNEKIIQQMMKRNVVAEGGFDMDKVDEEIGRLQLLQPPASSATPEGRRRGRPLR